MTYAFRAIDSARAFGKPTNPNAMFEHSGPQGLAPWTNYRASLQLFDVMKKSKRQRAH